MTVYSATIYHSNLAGEATGMDNLIEAMKVMGELFPTGTVTNAEWCGECKYHVYREGNSELFHTFYIRESAALELIKRVNFKWRKKKGMGRSAPADFLATLVASGAEEWYVVELFEF